MHRRSFSDVCEALAAVYLKDYEVAEYYRRRDREKFVSLVKQRLFDHIWRQMERYGEKAPPFLKNQEFIRSGCKAHIKEVHGIKYPWMEVDANKFIIYVERDLKDVQKRTYIAHELGHTFLYDLDKVPIQAYFERGLSQDLLEKNVYARHEGLVYEISRFLLVPSRILGDYVPHTPSLDAFMQACKTFETTPDVMVRRLLWDVYDWQSQARYWEGAFLLFCSVFDVMPGKNPPPPKGIPKVFRGSFLRNFEITRIWPMLVQMSHLAKKKPGEVIPSDECKGNDWFESTKFKKVTLKSEVEYIPEDSRIYMMIVPEIKYDIG